MNNILSEIKNQYLILDKKQNIFNNSNITLFAHKDIVWFFVLKNFKINEYILFIYWNIKKENILKLKKLYYKKNNIVLNIELLKVEDKFLYIKTEEKLFLWDFISYVPDYKINRDFLEWPYLDNLIWNLLIENYKNKVNIFHSIDEESKLLYSNFYNSEIYIIIDTIWQDFTNEEINLDLIYNIKSTKYTKLNILNIEWVKNIDLNLNFKLEPDFIKSKNIFYLLCPITNWHFYNSKVKISNIKKMKNILDLIIKSNKKNINNMS